MTDARLIPDGAAARLRDDIDHGRTGDKVDWPDPAAAPLGTDEEAAGTPVSPSIAESARRAEKRGVDRPLPARGVGAAWILVAIIVAAAAGLLVFVII